jgi:hypothetical protein
MCGDSEQECRGRTERHRLEQEVERLTNVLVSLANRYEQDRVDWGRLADQAHLESYDRPSRAAVADERIARAAMCAEHAADLRAALASPAEKENGT